jgi:N utilization substance protein B
MQFLYRLQYEDAGSLESSTQVTHRIQHLDQHLAQFQDSLDDKERLSPEALVFTTHLVEGCLKNFKAIKEEISLHSKKWPLEKMTKIDQTILILASFELIYDKQAKEIVIDEAIEMAKVFSELNAASFINGVLDSIAKKD